MSGVAKGVEQLSSFESKLLSRSATPCSRTRLRFPYHLVEPTVVAVDMIIVVAISLLAGIGYNWLFLDAIPATQTYIAIGVLTFTNVSAVLAARGAYRVSNLVHFYPQARDIVIIWTGVCLVLVGVAFWLKIGESFSRGAALTFFALGLSAMILWRALLAQLLVEALSAGAFAPRNVILLGEQSRLPNSRTILEMQRCGYTPVQSFEIRPEELATTEILPSLRATIDEAIEAARAGSVTEILLLVGWEHSRIIESITKTLGILPIPIYLLPDENVARYLGRRTIGVGTTWAAEIQRAPLTASEQFAKRCFDIIASRLGVAVVFAVDAADGSVNQAGLRGASLVLPDPQWV